MFLILTGEYRTIKQCQDRVELRYFWSKEVDPGSTRNNVTDGVFSRWVTIFKTLPKRLSTPETLSFWIKKTKKMEKHMVLLEIINIQALPLYITTRKRCGKFTRASVDFVSNRIQEVIDESNIPRRLFRYRI